MMKSEKLSRRGGFRPRVIRIKLNPEQAVLSCSCYTGKATGMAQFHYHTGYGASLICKYLGTRHTALYECRSEYPQSIHLGYQHPPGATTGVTS